MNKSSQPKLKREATSLFFVAVIPPDVIRNELMELKKKFANEFNSSHALKSPPHITLVPPFNFHNDHEKKLFNILIDVSRETNTFKTSIRGFGSFKPRVIYLKVLRNEGLESLYNKLNSSLIGREMTKRFVPHMTMVFRDLSPEMFYKAWLKYGPRRFESTFDVTSIFLLKHNWKYWEIYREFQFG